MAEGYGPKFLTLFPPFRAHFKIRHGGGPKFLIGASHPEHSALSGPVLIRLHFRANFPITMLTIVQLQFKNLQLFSKIGAIDEPWWWCRGGGAGAFVLSEARGLINPFTVIQAKIHSCTVFGLHLWHAHLGYLD
jgi:hypothetical protein